MSKYKILIIEDEENINNLLSVLLETNGYRVISARTCSEGVMMFSSHRPDLVILDHGKTLLSGNLREIKSGYGHTNLVVRTNDANNARLVQLAENAGLQLMEKRADESEYKITGDEMANGFLKFCILRIIDSLGHWEDNREKRLVFFTHLLQWLYLI